MVGAQLWNCLRALPKEGDAWAAWGCCTILTASGAEGAGLGED